MAAKRPPRAARATMTPAALQTAYRKRLDALVQEMGDSMLWWLRAEYRKQLPNIVPDAATLGQDAPKKRQNPVDALLSIFNERMSRWRYVMNGKARELAEWFVKRADGHVKRSLGVALRDATSHMTVSMRMTPAMETALASLVAENVALIKSIPQYYGNEVEGVVLRSVREGRDINFLETELQKRFSLTKDKVQLIARDQSNKATQGLHRARSLSLGITEGIWVHRAGRKTSRHTHEKMDGTRYALAEGCFDSGVGRNIQPGELINCRCTFRPILPELGD